MSILRKTIFATGFICVGAISTMGAQAMAGARASMGGANLARLLQNLDLTDEQQAQAEEIRQTMRTHKQAQRSERTERRDDLLDMLGDAQIDRDAVHAQIDAQAAEKLSFAHEMADMVIDLHATLDEGQREQLVETIAEGMERMEQRRQSRPSASPHGDE